MNNRSHPNPRRLHGRRGFTLIEIILAISIAVVLLGIGTLAARGWRSAKQLEGTIAEIENLARTARNGVLESQRPWVITFDRTSVSAAALDRPSPADQALGIQGVPAPPTGALTVRLKDDMDLYLRRTGWKDFLLIEVPETWRFEPRALHEAIEIRIESPLGWIQGRFDPLTARLIDTTMEAR